MSDADSELIAACQLRDPRAWATLVDRASPLVFAIARRCGLTDTDAEDVAQAVFTALLGSLESLRDPRAFWGWLATTTRREAVRVSQRRRREATGADAESAAAAPGTGDLEELAAVRRALGDLGGRCRDLLEALFFRSDGADYDAIARALDLPVGSIGPTRRRCLAKLMELLSPA
jgi:RNA polymerase sigma factor (sigma-70 family)